MRKFTSLLPLLLSGAMLIGCSSKDEFAEVPTQELYNQGQTYLQEEDYNNAIRYLEATEARNRQGAYGEPVQLGLIYANYKIGEYYKALEHAERYSRTFPQSPSMDYVYYLAALSNVRLSDNFMQDLLRVNNSSRAIDMVRNAYGSFQFLARNFPQSQYAAEAHQWMAYLKNRMAEHELNITKFYMKREAYVAAANRVQEMIPIYPEAKATQDALPLLKEAFLEMGIMDSAQKVEALIEANANKTFPSVEKPAYGEKF